MDGFTVSQANRFVNTAQTSPELKSITFENNESSEVGVSNKSFGDTLKEAVGTVNKLQLEADTKMQELAVGKNDNVAEVMIAAEKADIALRLMVQMRNKMIDAYHEIIKMQV
jgi:flagellar hook-basal body complex protein FliE